MNPQSINQGVVTPQVGTSFSPRLDYAINSAHTLTMRYQETRVNLEKEGIGNFSLPSRTYDQHEREDTIQATETAILSPKMINETRAQFLRAVTSLNGDNSVPAVTVQGAFEGGGAQVGRSGMVVSRLEMTNLTTVTAGAHIVKWGARVRHSFTDDTSLNNFGGTFTFFGGTGPRLDPSNQPIEGTSIELSALERYRRTLLFQGFGYTGARIRALGGGAPTSLDGTSVTIGSTAAFIAYISPNQLNALVPSSVGPGPQQISVTTRAGTSAPYTITVNTIQPGLLAPQSLKLGDKQYVGAVFADGATYVLPPGGVAGAESRPARPGEMITLYGVGFGAVTPGIEAGEVVHQSNALDQPLQIFFGPAAGTVTYAGLAPGGIGVYQFNVVVPNVAAGDALPLTFSLGGVAGGQTLYTAVGN